MATNVIGNGFYAGFYYMIFEKDGKKFIGLGESGIRLIAAGANLKLLNDIGDQDPDEVVAAFLESIPKEEKSKPEDKPLCAEAADHTI